MHACVCKYAGIYVCMYVHMYVHIYVFNIYLNDIFFFLDKNNVANYADDTTPYAFGKCLECVLKNLEDDVDI